MSPVTAHHTARFSWLGALALVIGCGGGSSPDATTPQSLTGAGATFPNPVYSEWFHAFNQATQHQINYQSVGSGAGVKQFIEGTVDFGATDAPMSDEELAAVQGKALHIPTVLGAVVLTWNLPSVASLQLDGTTLAGIFLGKITKWNDPKIAALNPGATLPDRELIVVHRSDGSGTSFIFTDYLAKVSPEWKTAVGAGKAVSWPAGLGGKGNEGVTQQIKQSEGAIGYVELIYAMSNGMPVASLKNSSGAFVTPSLESVTAAAAGTTFGADTDFRASITDASGAGAYPIASFTWLLVHPDVADAAKGRAMRDFLNWMVTPEATEMARKLHYAPLPEPVIALVKTRIATLTGAGAAL